MYNDKEDKEIKCACGETFLFTAGEQSFFEQRGLAEPKRCKSCRAERRRQQQQEEN